MSEGKRRSGSDSDCGEEQKVKRRKKTPPTAVASLKFDSCDVLIEDGIETNADLDYVSMMNIAMSRHKTEFRELKDELLEREETIPGVFLQRYVASVWVLDKKTGKKLNKLECTRKARKVRFVKKAAYNGLIQLMLRIQPKLSFEPNSELKKKKNKNKIKSSGKAQASSDGGKARNVLDMLKAKDKIDKRPAFRENMVGDQTKGGEGMLWVTSCTVFVDGDPITVTAETPKKKTSRVNAALMMIDRLLAVCDEETGQLIRKNMGYTDGDDDIDIGDSSWKQDGDKRGYDDNDNYNEASDGSESDDNADIGMDIDGKYSSNMAEFRIDRQGIFDTKGDVFQLPKGYKIKAAKTNAQCHSFISQNIASGTKVGVYLESRQAYASLHDIDIDIDIKKSGAKPGIDIDIDIGEGCDVVALAVKSGACLIVRKFFSEKEAWPPEALLSLFAGTQAELCGYKVIHGERALGFTRANRHRICDIEACGSQGIEIGEIGIGEQARVHASLKEIVQHWTAKKLDTRGASMKKTADGNGNDKKRMVTAVRTAAAVLSAYHSICNARDGKMRNRVGPCAMEGFMDLMNILTGRKDLFARVTAG